MNNDQNNENQRPDGNQPSGQTPPSGTYTHQNWNQNPGYNANPNQNQNQGQGSANGGFGQNQNPNPNQNYNPYTGARINRSPYAYQQPRQRKSGSRVLPVLLSIFLTFVITFGSTWVLASQGMLPGTQGQSLIAAPENQTQVGDLGLSIHTDDPQAQVAAAKLADIIKLLQDNYYKVLSPSEIIDAMSEGVINSMDSQYTYYMSSEDYSAFAESMSGNYSGIGATVTQLETGAFQIVSVIENGPAARTGLLPDDIILSVDGVDASTFASTQELASVVRGEDGSTVNLVISRDSQEMPFAIVRAQVVAEHVYVRMLDEITGYLNITDFATNLPEQFQAGLQSLLDQGATQIVFDLRGNPGGSAQAVVEVLDMLLPEGIVATTRGREDGKVVSEAWESGPEMLVPESMKYAILVNRNTASASELFSGALRDYGKAVLVGETTYGKGSGTRTYTLRDGSAANITIFNYYLPKGDLIEGIGLTPEIPADNISAEFRSIPLYRLTPEQDPALQAALDYLNQSEAMYAK